MAEKRFSKVKAAGLKSSLVTDNSVYMTTFGKHNEAILEKKIEDGRITNINNPEKLAVRIINNPKMSVSGLKVMDAVADNPLSKKAKNKSGDSDKLRSSRYIVGMDQLRIKEKLEEKYFGEVFDNENIHVQIAYNILDIKKILSVYINNIIYSVNNLRRLEVNGMEQEDDFIGFLYTDNKYKSLADNCARCRFSGKSGSDLSKCSCFKTKWDESLCEKAKKYNESSKVCDKCRHASKCSFFSRSNKVSARPVWWSPEKCNTFKELVHNCRICESRKKCRYNLSGKRTETDKWKFDVCGSAYSFGSYMNSVKPYIGYFRDVFYSGRFEKVRDKNGKTEKEELPRDYKDVYNILRIVGYMRQSVMHEAVKTADFLFAPVTDPEIKELIDRLYSEKVTYANRSFLKNNDKNVTLLFDYYNCASNSDKVKLIQDFYDFIVCQEQKNLGFNLRTIRENLLEDDTLKYIKGNSYDSLRSKLYTLLDFVLFKYYKGTPLQEEIVENLRACTSQEDKDIVYKKQAKEENLLREAKRFSKVIMPQMKGNIIRGTDKSRIDSEWISGVKLETKASDFTKILFVLTMFLDGKEINELLSGLQNKLSNISSFTKVLEEMDKSCSFVEKYKMFGKSETISRELRTLKSFVRMQREIPKHSRGAYIDAVDILGIDRANTTLSNMSDDDTAEELVEKFFIGGKDNNVRNFIINNVLKSRRFRYLVRYNNPKSTRQLAKNKDVVKFVLCGIPEAQINRYYTTVTGGDATIVSLERQIDELSNRISRIDFNNFTSVKQKPNTSEENIQKERMKAIIGLYLTVMYLVIKNLMRVNARYSIAVNCFERDTQYYNVFFKNQEVISGKLDPKELADRFADNGWSRDNWRDKNGRQHSVKEYGENLWGASFGFYRNAIAHHNVIAKVGYYLSAEAGDARITKIKSYYQLYHSVMQRVLDYELRNPSNPDEDVKRRCDYFRQCVALARENGSYSKELVKVLNYPYSYNLARYKNLVNEKTFEADRSKP